MFLKRKEEELMVIKWFKNLVGTEAQTEEPLPDDLDPLHYAAAVLMFEAAAVDGTIGEDEERQIGVVLGREFELDQDAMGRLLEAARSRAEASVQLLPAVRTINDHYTEEQKEHLFELLWSIILVDEHRDDHESVFMRRLTGLLYLSDKASGLARQRALQRIGSPGN